MSQSTLKVTKNKKENTNELELFVEATAELSSKAYSVACRNIANEANIPGFRKGKAPKDIIEKTYGKAFIGQKAFESVFYDLLVSVAKQENLEIVDIVEISSFELEPEKPLKFKTIVELKPDIKIGKYKNLKIKVKKMEYEKDKFINKTLEKIANNYTTLANVSGRTVKEGDVITVDFEGKFEDGTDVPGGKAENYQAVLEKDKFLPEFVNKLKGAKPGEEKDVVVSFPENFEKGFAGKKGIFKIKVKKIEERIIPKVDDELAKMVGNEDLIALKKKIVEHMIQLQDQNNRNEYENKLVDEIITDSKFEVSQRMIEKEVDLLLANLKEQTEQKGLSWQEFKLDEKNKEIVNKAREVALKRISIDLILNAVIQKENIIVTDDEINKEVSLKLLNADEKYKHLENDPRFRETVRLSTLRNKALDFLASNNKPEWDDKVNVIGQE